MKVKIEADFPQSMLAVFQALKDNPGVAASKQDLIDAMEMSDNFTVTSVEVADEN